jgi:seryl-tRNA synthetase
MLASVEGRWSDMERALEFERELSEIKAKQAAAEEQHKAIFRRLDHQEKLIEGVNALAISVRYMKHTQDEMQKEIKNVCSDVDAIKMKPVKRWETVVTECIKLLVAAAIGFMLSRFGI